LKSLIALWNMVANDYATRCCTSATKDVNTVLDRSKHEGFSFLTITLPSFGKDFQKSLDQGIVCRDSFQGFSWRAGLPQFLGGFLDNVFDRSTGTLLNDPCVDSVLAVRQLTLMFNKILLPCSDARVKDAMHGYIQCEQEVKESDAMLSSRDREDFLRISSLLFSKTFSAVDRDIYYGDVFPKHGPGATADKIRGNGKYNLRTWTDRLEEVFHCSDHLFPSVSHYAEQISDVHFLEPGDEIPVKVISVPKTMKTPRIIAVEPTCMQYMQQAVLDRLVPRIEKDVNLSQFIGFSDQTPNQRMAREGSVENGNLATLDLSEASDRVSNQLVRLLVSRFPSLNRAIDATRSRRADVPGHGVVRLAKFASMGSALCFPFEAMVFLTIIFIGIERELNVQFSKESELFDYLGSVRVYGDDIIVPDDMVHSVVGTLSLFGAKVGPSKSFWTGRFRESCGKEYFNGFDVSIVKVRRVFPSTRKHAPEVISLVELRNQLYRAGCWGTAKWLDSKIRRILPYYPAVSESSSVLGRYSFLGYDQERIDEHLHCPMVKGYVVSSVLPKDPLDGTGALLKFFLKRSALPSADRKHLERAGRPRSVSIKARWAKPY